ncbi:MAG: response regulator [Gammaproteobacteria bacterium]|nr:response regulator [Gammaproteobacteria bacterium]
MSSDSVYEGVFGEYFTVIGATPDASLLYTGQYNYALVFLSIGIAVFAAYTALLVTQFAERTNGNRRRLALLTIGGFTLGIGVWAMHFIGMLGFLIPCGVTYDPWIAALSMLPGIAAGIFSLHLISHHTKNLRMLLIGGVIFGGGIGVMHYSGMAAMRMDAFLRYDPMLFLVSILVAVALAMLALWVRCGVVRLFPSFEKHALLIAAFVMGGAVSGMHYTAMSAAYFLVGDVTNVSTSGFDPTTLSIFISGVTAFLIGAVLIYIVRQFSLQIESMNTELRKANNELKFQKISLDHHAIVSIADVAGNIIYANKNFCEISGYALDELMGKNHRLIKSDEHPEAFFKEMWETITNGNIWNGDIHNRSKQGKDYWVASTIVPFLDEEGKPFQYISIRTDITERMHVEERLKAQQLQISTISQAQARYITNSDPVTFFNSLLPDILSITGSEYGLIGEILVDDAVYLKAYAATNIAWDEKSRKYYDDHIAEGIEFHDLDTLYGHVILSGEVVLSNDPKNDPRYKGVPEGHPPLNAFLGLPIFYGEKLMGMIGVANRKGGYDTDLIDLLQPILSTCAYIFDALRHERERSQREQQLIEARIDAESAVVAKSQFLATMSHEIRTPMNGVLGMLHLLGKTELDERQLRYISTAASSSEMLLTIINDILDFSKIEAEKLDLESIPFSPVILAEETVTLMASVAHEKGLDIICAADPGVPLMVKGDPTRLRQILTNLVSNAIKFTEQGDVVLYISPMDDHKILFGVRDTGIGLSEKEQQRLFKAFSQVDSSHTRKYGGTGLGLAISQRLVTAMGGQIKVASAPGLGTDFSFILHLHPVSEHAMQIRDLVSDKLVQQRVLIVDDNRTNRQVLMGILDHWQVLDNDEAEGGIEAMQLLHAAVEEGRPYGIVLLDMQMPGMDGLELARSIRADKSLGDVNLVMLSSVYRDGVTPEVNLWLAKPVRQTDLYNALLDVLGEASVVEIERSYATESSEDWRFDGRRLLLVEDNLVNQEVAVDILTDVGFVVDVRGNGLEAVKALQAQAYELVLMDIQMPVMDGLEATREIRKLGGHFVDLPIIAMTAHSLTGDRDKSLASGMNAHVNKPIEPENLFSTIAKWIKPVAENVPVIEQADTEQTTDSELPDLPGLNVEEGVERMRGKWASYKRILISFHDKQQDGIKLIEENIQQDNWDEATRLAHSLKGIGGNISAYNIYRDAAALEEACRSRDLAGIKPLLAALSESLGVVMNGLADLKSMPEH